MASSKASYFGKYGSIAKKEEDRKKLHRGADDNASGTAAVMELARRFGQMKERQGRRLVFVAFSGEEAGLHGSAHYCKAPPFPLKDTVFMLNLDMVGRMHFDKTINKNVLACEGVAIRPCGTRAKLVVMYSYIFSPTYCRVSGVAV